MVEKISCDLEILSFFLVTTELYGRRRMARLAISCLNWTQERFKDLTLHLDDEFEVWTIIRLVLVLLTFVGVVILFANSIMNAHTWYSQRAWRAKQHDGIWVIFQIPAYDLIFLAFLTAACALMVAGILYLLIMSVFYLLAKVLFWRRRPQGGFLIGGAGLFIIAKVLEIMFES
jgi:hypothetical protein